MKLTWDPSAGFDGNGLGVAISSSKRVRLASRPALALDFESITFDTETSSSSKTVAGEPAMLTSDEISAIETFLENLP